MSPSLYYLYLSLPPIENDTRTYNQPTWEREGDGDGNGSMTVTYRLWWTNKSKTLSHRLLFPKSICVRKNLWIVELTTLIWSGPCVAPFTELQGDWTFDGDRIVLALAAAALQAQDIQTWIRWCRVGNSLEPYIWHSSRSFGTTMEKNLRCVLQSHPSNHQNNRPRRIPPLRRTPVS